MQTTLADCISEVQLLEYLSGVLSQSDVLSSDTHLAQCSECREVLLRLAHASWASQEPLTTSGDATQTVRVGDRIGRYILVEILGVGGMGVVYTAFDTELQRNVALKVVHPKWMTVNSRQQLRTEGRALAKLSHPNVVSVYDVGDFGDQVFVAMELIRGTSLDSWTKDKERSWQEQIAIHVLAGRGLSAAHTAGIVHRDFKPSNVLVSDDGTVCVGDFGLAIQADEQGNEPQVVQGTPAYMSPEQLAGKAVDGTTDQYSFCVTLFESLYGTRPSGESGAEQERPAKTDVPLSVHEAICRGLHHNPSARHSSIDALLDKLETKSSRHWIAPVIAAVVLTGIGGAYYLGRAQDQTISACQVKQSEARLDGIWDARRLSQLEQAFTDAGDVRAADFPRIRPILDSYAAGWVAMHQENCKATYVHNEQSEDLLDLRNQCLNRGKQQLDSLVSIAISDSDSTVHALRAANELASVQDCADIAALTAPVVLPTDEKSRQTVRRLRESLGKTKALFSLRDFEQGRTIAEANVKTATALGYQPVLAEVLFTLGNYQHAAGDPQTAAKTLHKAMLAAESSHHETLKADIMGTLAWFIGSDNARTETALTLGALAGAIHKRYGDRAAAAKLKDNLGIVYRAANRLEEALTHHQEALKTREDIFQANDLTIATTSNNVGAVLYDLKRTDEAYPYFVRAKSIWTAQFGENHPRVGMALNNLGSIEFDMGNTEKALALHLKALKVRQTVFEPGHPDISYSQYNLATVYRKQGRDGEALELFQKAHAAFSEVLGAEHSMSYLCSLEIATTLVKLGQLAEAAALAKSIIEKAPEDLRDDLTVIIDKATAAAN